MGGPRRRSIEKIREIHANERIGNISRYASERKSRQKRKLKRVKHKVKRKVKGGM